MLSRVVGIFFKKNQFENTQFQHKWDNAIVLVWSITKRPKIKWAGPILAHLDNYIKQKSRARPIYASRYKSLDEIFRNYFIAGTSPKWPGRIWLEHIKKRGKIAKLFISGFISLSASRKNLDRKDWTKVVRVRFAQV